MKILRPRRALSKLAVSPKAYRRLVLIGDRVVTFMTGNASFPTPTPTVAAVTAQIAVVRGLMLGNRNRRQSAADNVALIDEAAILFDLLNLILHYVLNTLGTPLSRIEFLSSGFQLEDVYSRTAKKLQSIKSFKQVNKASVPFTDRILKFKKPQGLIKKKKIAGYNFYASDVDGLMGEHLGSSTSTTFEVPIDFEGEFIMTVPFNTNGEGRAFVTRFYQ